MVGSIGLKDQPRATSYRLQADSRREFLKRAGVFVLGCCGTSRSASEAGPTGSNPVGYAAISWPQSQFLEALDTISSLGFAGVQMLGWVKDTYGGDKTDELKERLLKLRLQPAALSCSKVKPDPAHVEDESGKVREYATFLKGLGGLNLQVTDGGSVDGKYSRSEMKAFGAHLNELGKTAEEFDLNLGYHPHFGTFGETREGLKRVLDATDPRYVKLIADVAHLTLGGSDPAEVIRAYHARLSLVHLKDVRKDAAELARANRDLVRSNAYHFCEIGRGAVDFQAVFHALRGYQGWLIVELDGYEVPSGGPAESARINKEALQKLGLSP
jgi:sugar phosphate isomerase/epimerase